MSVRDTRSINLILLVHQAFFYTKASSLTERLLGLRFNSLIMLIHHYYIIISCKHTIKHIEDFTKLPNTYHSLLRVLLRNSINHNLPPPNNRDQAIYFPKAAFFSFSRSFSLPLLFFLFFLIQTLFLLP